MSNVYARHALPSVLILAWLGLCAASPVPTVEARLVAAEERSAVALETIAASPRPPQDEGCDPTEKVRTSDLCAQWRSADAADRTAGWSQMAALTSLGAFVAAFFAAIFTGVAAVHSHQTAKIAKRDEIFRNRPALWIGQVRLELAADVDLFGTLLIHNQGNSDATFTARCLGFKVWKTPDPATPVQEFQGYNTHGVPRLGPSTDSYEKWDFGLGKLSPTQLRKVKSGAEKFYLIGRFVYTFAPNVPAHHSIFAFEYQPSTGKFDLVRDRDYTFGVVVDAQPPAPVTTPSV